MAKNALSVVSSIRAKKKGEVEPELETSEDVSPGTASGWKIGAPSMTRDELEDTVEDTPTEKRERSSSSGSSTARLSKKIDRLTSAIQAQQESQRKQIEALVQRSEPVAKEPKVPSLAPLPAVSNAVPETASEKQQLAKFNRDVRRAFQGTSSQLLLAVLLILGYFTLTVSSLTEGVAQIVLNSLLDD